MRTQDIYDNLCSEDLKASWDRLLSRGNRNQGWAKMLWVESKDGCFWILENQGRHHREGHSYGVHHKCVLSRGSSKRETGQENTEGFAMVRNAVCREERWARSKTPAWVGDLDGESGHSHLERHAQLCA